MAKILKILGVVVATSWDEAAAKADHLVVPPQVQRDEVVTPGGRVIYQWPAPGIGHRRS